MNVVKKVETLRLETEPVRFLATLSIGEESEKDVVWTNRWMDRRTEGRMDSWTKGGTDGKVGQVDGWNETSYRSHKFLLKLE